MAVAFTRQLGAEAGVQLNPLRDNSEIPTADNYDQLFAIMCRLTRGRIDKPFKVNRGNYQAKIGKGEAMRTSALNEAWVHIVEALNNGAYEAVVQRLVTSAAVIKYAVCKMGVGAALTPVVALGVVTGVTVVSGGTGYVTGQALAFTGGGGSGAVATITATAGVITAVTVSAGGTLYATAPTATVTNPLSWADEADIPAVPYLLAIKHLECFNDGIQCEFHVEEKRSGGVSVANDKINLRINDIDGLPLFNFVGSLDPASVDDYGNSNYLPDLVASQTDAVEVTVGATITTIPTTSPAYGYGVSGLPNWSQSGTLVCFTEGGTGYTTQDYVDARTLLQTTPFNYGYISSGGSQAAALIAQLIQLAYDTNRPMAFDVHGSLNKEAAITFYEQLNVGGNFNSSHLIWAYWTPLKTQDPTGINGKGFLGAATLMIAYACGRNAVKNSKGYARKNYPIAGRDFPLNRRAVTQVLQLSGQDKNDLARAKINPVISETYTGGQRYVFLDSLTGALVENSLRKLTAVIDMSVDIDDRISRRSKDLLQQPIDVVVEKMKDFLHQMRADLRAAGWIVPPKDTSFSTDYFAYEVKPHDVLVDAIVVNYWPCFVGTTRQIFLTQTLVI